MKYLQEDTSVENYAMTFANYLRCFCGAIDLQLNIYMNDREKEDFSELVRLLRSRFPTSAQINKQVRKATLSMFCRKDSARRHKAPTWVATAALQMDDRGAMKGTATFSGLGARMKYVLRITVLHQMLDIPEHEDPDIE